MKNKKLNYEEKKALIRLKEIAKKIKQRKKHKKQGNKETKKVSS